VPAKYKPARYRATPVLNGFGRHVVSRFSYGTTPELVAAVEAAGGPLPWFEQQLATAYDGERDAEAVDWWPDLHLSPQQIWQNQVEEKRGSWEVMWDYSRRLLARRITSSKQVLEVMTEFWESHLHVTANGDAQAMWRVPYGDVIRKHALGRFDEMLVEAVTHPAMLLYLDGASSTKSSPNENLGREVLELHTVGFGSYSEPDVKNAMRALTGYRVDMWRTWEFSYRNADHWTGPITVGSFSHPNSDADGREVVRQMLVHLAHRPETARRIARKLAVKFIGDDASDDAVAELATVYLKNGTAIVPVLQRLVRMPEFRRSKRTKLRGASEDVVATYRALGAQLHAPSGDEDAANAVIWQARKIGLMPMGWPRPDGAPLDNESWAGPARALASMDVHWSLAGGWWPSTGIEYRAKADWAPELPIAFDELVDHMARVAHGRPSDSVLLKACCQAVDTGRDETITGDHKALRWLFPRLLVTVLDHPNHYVR